MLSLARGQLSAPKTRKTLSNMTYKILDRTEKVSFLEPVSPPKLHTPCRRVRF